MVPGEPPQEGDIPIEFNGIVLYVDPLVIHEVERGEIDVHAEQQKFFLRRPSLLRRGRS